MMPINPATQPPGLEISIRIAWTPMESKRKTRLGLVRSCRTFSIRVCSSVSTLAPAVCRVMGSPETTRVRPSSQFKTSARSRAIKSTSPASSASTADTALAFSMVSSANATASAPRPAARLRTCARKASFNLASIVSPISSPSEPTGLAAPIMVSGAITAACPARVMMVPALPAMAPLGAT